MLCPAGNAANDNRTVCNPLPEVVRAQEAAAQVTAGMVTVLAVTMTSVAASSVAASVAAGGAAAAASGGADGAAGSGGGAGAGPALCLLGQVQMASVTGRVGGAQADAESAAFSEGMAWAKYDVQIPAIFGARNRTSAAARRRAGGVRRKGNVDTSDSLLEVNVGSVDCSWDNIGNEFLRTVIICVFVLACVFVLRVLVLKLYMCKWPGEEPDSLLFPAWEAPLFLSQLLGLCESFMGMVVSGCFYWSLVGYIGLSIGPCLFLVWSTVRMFKLWNVRLKWEPTEELTWTEVWREAMAQPTTFKRLSRLRVAYVKKRYKGDWDPQCSKSKWWSNFVSDYSVSISLYLTFEVSKQIAIAIIVVRTEGAGNAISLCCVYLLHSLLVIFGRPFRDNHINFTMAVRFAPRAAISSSSL